MFAYDEITSGLSREVGVCLLHDYVHVLFDGRIVKTGDASLAHKLEAQGYDWIKEEIVAS